MKIALMSDIHANLQAFDACLAHARQAGVGRFALLGDLVGYGGEPIAVLERVRALAAEGAVVIKGNHDEMAVAPGDAGKTIGGSTADWTHRQLDDAQRAWLEQLPLTHAEGTLLLVHASADTPARWRYVDDERSAGACLDAAVALPAVRHVFCGHVHQQALFYRGAGRGLMKFSPTPGVAVPMPRHRHWVSTIGSVGQPRDGDPRAMYAIYDDATSQVTFQRVPYNHAAAAQAIRRAGLPEYFAKRLEDGR